MSDDKGNRVHEYIKFVKGYDVRKSGPINSDLIEERTCYCRRQFSRIFNEYSMLTPLEYAERSRLLTSVEYIKKGNTLKNAAIQFGYSPEGLSNAIRKKFGLTVEKIKREDFELKKSLKVSNMWKRKDNYKLEYDKAMFIEILEGMDEEKVLQNLGVKNANFNPAVDGFDVHLKYNRICSILNEFDGSVIEKKMYENFDFSEAAIMYILLKKNKNSGQLKMRESELITCLFIIGFFFDIENPELKEGQYIFNMENNIREIFNSLKEIEEVTEEIYSFDLHAVVKNNKVEVELDALYKEMLMIISDSNYLV